MIQPLIISAIAIFFHMNIWFVISILRKRNDTVDTAWGLGFIIVILTSILFFQRYETRQLITLLLVTLWGLRLATYIFIRNKGKKEDYRYQEMKDNWGKDFLKNTYLKIFMLQVFLMLLVSSALTVIGSTKGSSINLLDILGIFIWVIGLFFETVGDWQLNQFVKDKSNKGKIMKSGLWKYTRHPNYFGEVTLWWGIFILSLSHPYKLLSLVGPVTITILITKVSGIPLLEKKYESNVEFQEYAKKTSVFFPKKPKKSH